MSEPRKSKGRRRADGKGPFKYHNPEDNHVIWPGREPALRAFIAQSYGGMQHKKLNALSSNSEDALTWSCFDLLAQCSPDIRRDALRDVWELALGTRAAPEGVLGGDIRIGKRFGDSEATEVDVSIEGPGALVFVEAKLYSPMSQADAAKRKPHNQIERKLRVGLREAARGGALFYFILLDLAPLETLRALNPGASLEEATRSPAAGFGQKWLTAYWFARYKYGVRGSLAPLRKLLFDAEVKDPTAEDMASRMGWLTWADVFKSVLRATVEQCQVTRRGAAP
jgi:hypothetical protein